MAKKLTTEEFIKRAREVHGDKYDYSKVEYKTTRDKITIICPIHGEFEQSPNNHLRGRGCPKCANNIKKTSEEFIERANKVHGCKYDYSYVEYINNKKPVKIMCPIHGEFYQKPEKHLTGQGCPYCNGTYKKTLEEFEKEAGQIHNHAYDYSKVEYVNNYTKVCIICPKHGEFYQTPHNHLTNRHGCPFCKRSKLEMEVEKLLRDNGIGYIGQMKFGWLGSKSLDFYIPSLNIAIECQGRQHFEPVKAFGGEDEYKRIVERDREKYNLCKKNGVKLLYYSHKSIFGKHELKHDVITTRKLLLEEIK